MTDISEIALDETWIGYCGMAPHVLPCICRQDQFSNLALKWQHTSSVVLATTHSRMNLFLACVSTYSAIRHTPERAHDSHKHHQHCVQSLSHAHTILACRSSATVVPFSEAAFSTKRRRSSLSGWALRPPGVHMSSTRWDSSPDLPDGLAWE